MTDFTELTDLASRAFGGSVVTANDEFFAPRENLIRPEPAAPVHTFGFPPVAAAVVPMVPDVVDAAASVPASASRVRMVPAVVLVAGSTPARG